MCHPSLFVSGRSSQRATREWRARGGRKIHFFNIYTLGLLRVLFKIIIKSTIIFLSQFATQFTLSHRIFLTDIFYLRPVSPETNPGRRIYVQVVYYKALRGWGEADKRLEPSKDTGLCNIP